MSPELHDERLAPEVARSRDLTTAELVAIQGMMEGKIEGLADLLEGEEPTIHPMVQRYIVRLIRGSAAATDYRLKVIMHPDLKSPKQGRQAGMREQSRQVETAVKMAQFGALRKERGSFKVAVSHTVEATGADRATVCRHWRQQKAFIRFLVAHGHLHLEGGA